MRPKKDNDSNSPPYRYGKTKLSFRLYLICLVLCLFFCDRFNSFHWFCVKNLCTKYCCKSFVNRGLTVYIYDFHTVVFFTLLNRWEFYVWKCANWRMKLNLIHCFNRQRREEIQVWKEKHKGRNGWKMKKEMSYLWFSVGFATCSLLKIVMRPQLVQPSKH
jgi:hypothetical protein